jgi:hypothetical protein
MREKLSTIALATALTAASSGACAMSTPQLEAARCHVVGGDRLPRETGGADALCRAIKEAVAARAPKLQYIAAVRVLSASSLAATIKFADGRTLPEQRMATMDRALTKASIERFAQALAAEMAKIIGR